MVSDIFEKYKSDMRDCYKSIGVKRGENLYITGNISKLGRLRVPKHEKLRGLYEALKRDYW